MTDQSAVEAGDDHQLAATLAELAGNALVKLRDQEHTGGFDPWGLRDSGDRLSHQLLVKELADHRPNDIVLSEEGRDDHRRLESPRTWILDPLDGTHDYPFTESIEWAVHVALVEQNRPTAAAVSVPGMERVFSTADGEALAERGDRDRLLVITPRSSGYLGSRVAESLNGDVAACGSAGVKAMLVVIGAADSYIHGSGLYEWDACAPAAVAEAFGLVVTDIAGNEILYNNSRPVVQGLVISRPEFAASVRSALDEVITN